MHQVQDIRQKARSSKQWKNCVRTFSNAQYSVITSNSGCCWIVVEDERTDWRIEVEIE